MALRKVECAFCSEMFETDKNAALYCSARCRRQATNKKRRENNANRAFKCAFCGKLFISSRKRKYCNEKCRLMASGRLLSKPRERKKPTMTLEQIVSASRKEGLSYGQYVKKYGL